MKYEKVHGIYNKLVGIEDIDPTLVYIQYMKFARRAEGIKSGRTIFKKAREDLRTRHHVYVTAALMEYYCSKVSTHNLMLSIYLVTQFILNKKMIWLNHFSSFSNRINQWPSRSLSLV